MGLYLRRNQSLELFVSLFANFLVSAVFSQSSHQFDSRVFCLEVPSHQHQGNRPEKGKRLFLALEKYRAFRRHHGLLQFVWAIPV